MLNTTLWRAMLVAAFVVPSAAGFAQDVERSAPDAFTSATPQDLSAGENLGTNPEFDEAAVASALYTELLPSPDAKPKSFRPPEVGASGPTWSKTSNSDGSAKYSVNKALAAPWDAKIGADISVAPPPAPSYDPRALPGTTTSNAGAGSAWANVAVPHLATVEVRAEPANDYDKIGTRLERTLALGKSLSVTMQSSFDFTDLHASQSVTAVNVLPSTAATRVFDADKSLQLNILSSGTTLSAGSTSITGDPVTHNRVTAAQRIYGPLTVTGSINDVGQSTSSKSISAGLNLSW